MRLGKRPMRHTPEVACVDMTGGTAGVTMLTDNGVKKVLVTMVRDGVYVDMALSPAEAADFRRDLTEVIRWAA